MTISKGAITALLNGLILMVLTLAEFWGLLPFHLLLSYQWHKILHIFGVVMFMGNMIAGPVWFLFAYYSGDKALLSFAARLLYLTDLYLTVPGIALTVINGLFLASAFGGTHQQPWLFYSIILMIVMWLLSVPLIFLQEKIYATIQNEPDNALKMNRLMNWWGVLGTLVSLPPIVIFYLMVAKSI
ncbi:MAG: DUF2269 family protein [Saprospiraceae bacterium]|nr:DUF2269 family protein [Saprospiraceae bacterium]